MTLGPTESAMKLTLFDAVLESVLPAKSVPLTEAIISPPKVVETSQV